LEILIEKITSDTPNTSSKEKEIKDALIDICIFNPISCDALFIITALLEICAILDSELIKIYIPTAENIIGSKSIEVSLISFLSFSFENKVFEIGELKTINNTPTAK